MKKLFLFIIIFNFAVASDKIIYKKEKNTGSSLNETLISIKKGFISKINFFTPDYLQINPDRSFFNLSADYNTLQHKLSSSFSLHIKLPALKIAKFRQIKQTKHTSKTFVSKSLLYQYKLRPYLKLKDSTLKIYLSNSFLLKNVSFLSYSFLDTFDYYPFDNYWEESVQFQIKKQQNTLDLTVSTNKDTKSDYSYTLGIYHSLLYKFKIIIFGYEISGYKNLKPFCYSHKIFISYRQKLFRSSRLFMEIKPYLFYSKSYGFHLKEAVDVNINYKF